MATKKPAKKSPKPTAQKNPLAAPKIQKVSDPYKKGKAKNGKV